MRRAPGLTLAGRRIGLGHPTYLIAELSGNHNGNYATARKLVHAAAKAGADAVKLQTYTADTLTLDCKTPPFRIGKGTVWKGRYLHDLYSEAATPWEWQPRLMKEARRLGLDLFSSPFDDTAVDFLARMDVPAYKVASFEIVDLPLIRKIARQGKPIILSTGMATIKEIGEAVATARAAGARQLALLKCTSAYPAPASEMDLLAIPQMQKSFGLPVGLSDHTLGTTVPTAAVALGACIVEKHLTLARHDGGPDSAFSLEPGEFADMVRAVRTTEEALGKVRFGVHRRERPSLAFRRSLFVVEDIKKGEPLTTRNVRSIRPGHGLHTRYLEDVLDRPAARDVKRGTPLEWKHVSPGRRKRTKR